MNPFLSVVMPVHDGARFLMRAWESLRRQTFADWELLAVDDGSRDSSPDLLAHLAAADARVRVLRHPVQAGVSAARNTALRQARGSWIAYLDCDDEYLPNYLEKVHAFRERGEVLVFAYDVLEERTDQPHCGRAFTWNPRKAHHLLLQQHIAVPLGVAHRRDLLARSGLFDETLRHDEDTDLWQRFARAGAVFHFLGQRSGIYHVRSDSLSRTRPVSEASGGELAVLKVPFRNPSGARETFDFRVPHPDLEVARNVLEQHCYKVPTVHLRRPPVVLDVGANAGAFAVYVKLFVHPQATIHCFEPHPGTFALLGVNTASFEETRLHPFALGDRDASVPLYVHERESVRNSLLPDLVPSGKVGPTVALRDSGRCWDELGLEEIDILKVDAEGSEPAILASLGARLKKVRCVLVEFHDRKDRRRIDALLADFDLFHTRQFSFDVGEMKYLRADLVP